MFALPITTTTYLRVNCLLYYRRMGKKLLDAFIKLLVHLYG